MFMDLCFIWNIEVLIKYLQFARERDGRISKGTSLVTMSDSAAYGVIYPWLD